MKSHNMSAPLFYNFAKFLNIFYFAGLLPFRFVLNRHKNEWYIVPCRTWKKWTLIVLHSVMVYEVVCLAVRLAVRWTEILGDQVSTTWIYGAYALTWPISTLVYLQFCWTCKSAFEF